MADAYQFGGYILAEDGTPILEPDVLKWAEWFGRNPNRHVAEDFVGDVRVSTVFLGIDHNFQRFFSGDTTPVLWETMIFGGPHDGYQERYTSREAAGLGHKAAVVLAQSSEPQRQR